MFVFYPLDNPLPLLASSLPRECLAPALKCQAVGKKTPSSIEPFGSKEREITKEILSLSPLGMRGIFRWLFPGPRRLGFSPELKDYKKRNLENVGADSLRSSC